MLFCWTRFGTEAGETIEAILGRKERERLENAGVFLWGVGNSVAPAIVELVRQKSEPEVLFSPIKGPPRSVDVAPSHVVEWRVGETIDGRRFTLAPTFHVRGGRDTTVSPRYALVCASDEPLAFSDQGRLNFGTLRNLISGNPLGASQVTAVVRRLREGGDEGREYVVALRARLVEPFFIRLREPVPLEFGAKAMRPARSSTQRLPGVAGGIQIAPS